MNADQLGLELIASAQTEQEALWAALARALGAQGDDEVGEKLPPKDAYEQQGAALLFPAVIFGGMKSPFVVPLDAWVKWSTAWSSRFKEFVRRKDEATEEVREAVSVASREIVLPRWQILTSKGWVSGYTASDDVAESLRRGLRDGLPDLGKTILIAVVIIAAITLSRR